MCDIVVGGFRATHTVHARLQLITRCINANQLLFYLLNIAFFGDKKAQTITASLGHVMQMDPVNARTILHMPLTDDPQIIVQMVYAAIAAGLIPDKSKGKSISANYKCPEMDVSGIPTV